MTERRPLSSHSPLSYSRLQPRSFFPGLRASLAAGLAVATLLTASLGVSAQTTTGGGGAVLDPTPAGASRPLGSTPGNASGDTPNAPTNGAPVTGKTRKAKEEKVVQSKDTKSADKRYKKENPLEGQDAKLPDKELYDKAEDAVKHGRFDVARLDLQTLLNTYPDSQFQMRAKLAIADSWYKEGGTAAYTQAEQEYRDFITFFPNQPEAAEAQMRIGDIYFHEMDKPDRDNSKAVLAELNYRLMLQQFPESPRIPEAAQRLREVQESLAGAESDVATFYATRTPPNYPAAIARYETVAETYPLYSHMDDVLVGLGDAYEAEARFYRDAKLPGVPAAARERLVNVYQRRAVDAWRKVVLEHSAAAHVEDARDRLASLNMPIPTPTPQQMAASSALEDSRGQYTLSNRALIFVLHRPDTVPAATKGDPPLQDPKPVLAPSILNTLKEDFVAAMNPGASAAPINSPLPPSPAPESAITPAATPAPAPTSAPAAPLAFQDVPTSRDAAAPAAAFNPAPSASSAPSSGSGVGVQIVQPDPNTPVTTQPGGAPPAFPGTASPAPAQPTPAVNPADGLVPATRNTGPLPAAEKATVAPDAINEIVPGTQPAAQKAPANGKKPKTICDTKDESCSKEKKKKGLDKLNPF